MSKHLPPGDAVIIDPVDNGPIPELVGPCFGAKLQLLGTDAGAKRHVLALDQGSLSGLFQPKKVLGIGWKMCPHFVRSTGSDVTDLEEHILLGRVDAPLSGEVGLVFQKFQMPKPVITPPRPTRYGQGRNRCSESYPVLLLEVAEEADDPVEHVFASISP